MKWTFVFVFLFIFRTASGQELYVFTEPASTMAAKNLAIRLNNYLMKDIHTDKINYHLIPEVRFGISKKLMIHAAGFLSNRENQFIAEGGSLYLQHRFLSIDEVHKHFRLAVFARFSSNNTSIHQYAIDLNGHNSGYEGGIIATQLINKVAFTGSLSSLHATDNGKEKFLFGNKSRNAMNYSLSVGKLMLPKEYTSYKQVNVNLMVELLGQTNLSEGYHFLDIAPSVQLIFNSRFRFDAAYRYPLITKLHRTAPEGVLLRVEYNIFNIGK